MTSNQSAGGAGQENDHSTYNEEELMDRSAQAGVEGAFEADPQGESVREQMRQDAQDAFGGQGDAGGGGSGGSQGDS